MNKPRILLLGPGAVGVYFTSRLAAAHAAEIFVAARSDYETLQKNASYRILSKIHGEYDFRPDGILRAGEEPPFTPDYTLVCCKACDHLDQTHLFANTVKPGTLLTIIQNGIDCEKPFAEAFPGIEIAGAAAYLGASRPAPAAVLHTDGGRLIFGAYPSPQKPAAKLKSLAGLFKKSGVPASLTDDLARIRWVKLLWNAAFNPASVLAHSADTREIMDSPSGRALMKSVMEEVAAIAGADGKKVAAEEIRQTLAYTQTFAAYRPSMLQDFEAGKPVELEAILGKPLRIAQQHRIPAPHLRTMYALMKLAVRGHTGAGNTSPDSAENSEEKQ